MCHPPRRPWMRWGGGTHSLFVTATSPVFFSNPPILFHCYHLPMPAFFYSDTPPLFFFSWLEFSKIKIKLPVNSSSYSSFLSLGVGEKQGPPPHQNLSSFHVGKIKNRDWNREEFCWCCIHFHEVGAGIFEVVGGTGRLWRFIIDKKFGFFFFQNCFRNELNETARHVWTWKQKKNVYSMNGQLKKKKEVW